MKWRVEGMKKMKWKKMKWRKEEQGQGIKWWKEEMGEDIMEEGGNRR